MAYCHLGFKQQNKPCSSEIVQFISWCAFIILDFYFILFLKEDRDYFILTSHMKDNKEILSLNLGMRAIYFFFLEVVKYKY